jgi:uncharacterized protein (TIGR02757 family)
MPPTSRLKAPLEQLCREADWARRIDRDAIRYPLRYPDPADREIVALLSACLAYGRVDLFGPWIEWALTRMGESPHRFVLGFDAVAHARLFDGFHYRFNRAHDLVAFCLSGRRVLSEHGSLGAFFTRGFERAGGSVGPALETFVEGFVGGDLSGVFPRNQLSYGYRHWFPRPSTGGACKRLLLFLRWMVRREPPDFGLWTGVPPAALLIPVDTHIENMARSIGLTRRRTRNWKMAEEITARLRTLDPDDPVKYDFALCHKRMSGQCLNRRDAVVCAPCSLRPVCNHWRGRQAMPGAA